MQHKNLWVWVEGNDDARLFKERIKPIFDQRYSRVRIRTYRHLNKKLMCKLISVANEENADYFLVADINSAPCPSAKKSEVRKVYSDLEDENIIVVIREIEGWYLAGLGNDSCRSLGIETFNNTDQIGKGKFKELMPTKYDSRVDYMSEILKHWNIRVALKKNSSFSYFAKKYNL
ncbi:hypothetical protein CEE37_02895 [candidate division LCP-89 bacterium B3_LCP]|uniref:DUF4276 family protein n=1 Tax=candidate division LCP-89 bacterium B3_LCP TaxID=2012998 RepID=A0A532V2U0_UNCL8|nr:MAG: hypothetical protein CEE37_02895 [candidate division LCP-89 bacterium B3_LCP]